MIGDKSFVSHNLHNNLILRSKGVNYKNHMNYCLLQDTKQVMVCFAILLIMSGKYVNWYKASIFKYDNILKLIVILKSLDYFMLGILTTLFKIRYVIFFSLNFNYLICQMLHKSKGKKCHFSFHCQCHQDERRRLFLILKLNFQLSISHSIRGTRFKFIHLLS
jgi:hypothetical protein